MHTHEVFYASIEHKHGSDTFMAGSQDALDKLLADYVFQWREHLDDWADADPAWEEKPSRRVNHLYEFGEYREAVDFYMEAAGKAKKEHLSEESWTIEFKEST